MVTFELVIEFTSGRVKTFQVPSLFECFEYILYVVITDYHRNEKQILVIIFKPPKESHSVQLLQCLLQVGRKRLVQAKTTSNQNENGQEYSSE